MGLSVSCSCCVMQAMLPYPYAWPVRYWTLDTTQPPPTCVSSLSQASLRFRRVEWRDLSGTRQRQQRQIPSTSGSRAFFMDVCLSNTWYCCCARIHHLRSNIDTSMCAVPFSYEFLRILSFCFLIFYLPHNFPFAHACFISFYGLFNRWKCVTSSSVFLHGFNSIFLFIKDILAHFIIFLL